MNEGNIAIKRMRGHTFDQTPNRKWAYSSESKNTNLRWPRPTKASNLKQAPTAKSSEPLSNGGSNFRQEFQRLPQANSQKAFSRSSNLGIWQPKPIKMENLGRQFYNGFGSKSCGSSSQLNWQQRSDDNAQTDDFTQELEDRIEADLEVESIFESAPQARSLSLGKSLPERPANPIIKDKYFKTGGRKCGGSIAEKLPPLSDKRLAGLNSEEGSIERQRRIMQEDYEAETEMNQLLFSPVFRMQNQTSSLGSISCSSELSSFESEFSRVLSDEISPEN